MRYCKIVLQATFAVNMLLAIANNDKSFAVIALIAASVHVGIIFGEKYLKR